MPGENDYRETLIGFLGEQNEPGSLFSDILQMAMEHTEAEGASVYIEDNGTYLLSWAENKKNRAWKNLYPGLRVAVDANSLSGYSAYNNRELWIPDVRELPTGLTFDASYDENTGFITNNSYTIPFRGEDIAVAGVLQLVNIQKPDREFLHHVTAFLAYDVARIRRIRKDTLRVIRLAALRDPKETAEHVIRVGELSVILRTAIGEARGENRRLLMKARNSIYYAAMLHDVGKVGIADEILKKPGKLTDAERSIMEQHTRLGWNLLDDTFCTDIDKQSRNVILNHHQRFDGRGYPRDFPLKGEEIPLEARIVAIADVWDALTNERCYKKSFSREKSLAIMQEGRGTQFDPELLDIFLHKFGEEASV